MTIPIRNLYYLLCYAWERFPDAHPVDVGVDAAPDLPNLLARILVNDVHRLLRRGLDRGYRAFVEETRAPRGRLLLDDIVKQQTLRRGAVVCAIDELTPDVAHNRIIKATCRLLTRNKSVDHDLRHELGLIVQRMAGVSDTRLTGEAFKRIQLSRNTRQYRPLLRLCELVFRAQLPVEDNEGSSFADILKDDILMSAVFEDFLRNFYHHNQKRYSVGREIMAWDALPLDDHSRGRMPVMETDITLRSRERTIVMDAKFYREMLVSKGGPGKIRSGHLYQLFAYVEHAGAKAPHLPCDGALLYPAVGEPIAFRYQVRGHEILVKSIDLGRDHWQDIHDDLLSIPSSFGLTPPSAMMAA